MYIPPHLLSAFVSHLTTIRLSLAQQNGLTIRHVQTLGTLAFQGTVTFKELHRALSIPKSAVTGIIDDLHHRGIVERNQDKKDRRRWFVSLAPSGRKMADKLHLDEARSLEPFLQELTESEQQAFHNLLEAFGRGAAWPDQARKSFRRRRT